jgi:hypothetical protein
MKKRWILNLILLCVVASLVAFLYLRPKSDDPEKELFEISSYKLAEFNAISVEFPAKATLSFAKVDGYWRITAPNKTRADQASVQRILSIIAAKSKNKIVSEKFGSEELEKFGLTNPAVKLKLFRNSNNVEEFLFGTYNPVIELVDKAPLKPTEKVVGFNFSQLEQWEASRLNVDIVDGQWKVSIAAAKPLQNELNEWLDYSWLHTTAKSVEFYTPDRSATYPSFEVKMADGSKVHFDKMQESPEMILARPDEGLLYHFPADAGFTMLNPPINPSH